MARPVFFSNQVLELATSCGNSASIAGECGWGYILFQQLAMAHDDHDDADAHGHVHTHAHTAHEHDEILAGHGHARPLAHSLTRGDVSAHAREPLECGAGAGMILHFDCFAGIAGDMCVGSLLDLGVPITVLQLAVDSVGVAGLTLTSSSRESHSIRATALAVHAPTGQPQRNWRDIERLLVASPLDDGVRRRALDAFGALAEAEAQIHGIPPADVHFHEVGAIDAIADIVAASAGIEWLGADVSCSPLPMGRGFIRSDHGRIPLPAPAVVELLRGIPTMDAGLEGETVTPTGAALMRANAKHFVAWPAMRPVRTGFGAGTRTWPDRPNLVRAVLGEPYDRRARETAFAIVETNIDDATGESVGRTIDALFEAGALDAWTSAIGMKKNRPAVLLSALGPAGDADRLARVMLGEGTTLGVRIRPCERVERPRRLVMVETEFGTVSVKIADGDGLPETAKPEHDEVVALARTHGVPARVVYAAVISAMSRRR